jgi:hypothetical protein
MKAGDRFQSVVCSTEVIVIRAPADEVALSCGGQPMMPAGGALPVSAAGAATTDGALLGKRYEHELVGLELLVTRAGAGPLEAGGTPLEIKRAKPLPSSD